ncbi:MAG: hypothetical protein Q8P02_02175 [Candidatus Micrarchaeota archaeon]|nr:hypothetical protein [Candidatus Micrarchaeota archaeon]
MPGIFAESPQAWEKIRAYVKRLEKEEILFRKNAPDTAIPANLFRKALDMVQTHLDAVRPGNRQQA